MDNHAENKHTNKDRVIRAPLQIAGELRCSGSVGSSCSTSGTRRLNLVIQKYNSVVSGETLLSLFEAMHVIY